MSVVTASWGAGLVLGPAIGGLTSRMHLSSYGFVRSLAPEGSLFATFPCVAAGCSLTTTRGVVSFFTQFGCLPPPPPPRYLLPNLILAVLGTLALLSLRGLPETLNQSRELLTAHTSPPPRQRRAQSRAGDALSPATEPTPAAVGDGAATQTRLSALVAAVRRKQPHPYTALAVETPSLAQAEGSEPGKQGKGGVGGDIEMASMACESQSHLAGRAEEGSSEESDEQLLVVPPVATASTPTPTSSPPPFYKQPVVMTLIASYASTLLLRVACRATHWLVCY